MVITFLMFGVFFPKLRAILNYYGFLIVAGLFGLLIIYCTFLVFKKRRKRAISLIQSQTAFLQSKQD